MTTSQLSVRASLQLCSLVLTLRCAEADAEELHLVFAVSIVHCRPHPGLVTASVLLQLGGGHDCNTHNTMQTADFVVAEDEAAKLQLAAMTVTCDLWCSTHVSACTAETSWCRMPLHLLTNNPCLLCRITRMQANHLQANQQLRLPPQGRDPLIICFALPMWLALILRVFSCRISRRIFWFALCCSSLMTPRPRSFHSLVLASYLYSLHFLQRHVRSRQQRHPGQQHC